MNRRKLLAGGAAALPLAVAGVATAEAAPVAETSMQTMIRHAKALAVALAEWNKDFPSDDIWIAQIHPMGRFDLTSLQAMHGNWRPSPITDLFRQWQAARDRCDESKTEAEVGRAYTDSVRLQQEIIDAVPRTPGDVAMQFYADSHGTDSDHSPQFIEGLLRLAGIERRNRE